MSSLNKAFIKAYRKSAVEAKPAGPRPHFIAAPAGPAKTAAKVSLNPPAEHVAAVAPIAAPIVSPMIERTIAPAPVVSAPVEMPKPLKTASVVPAVLAPEPAADSIPITVVDRAHATVRPPHANFADPPRPSTAATVIASPATTSAPLATPPLDTPPVSPRPVILPISGPSPVWRPVFEVSSFSWPELTDVLLEAAAAQFRAAASDLAEACRRHRKLVTVTASHRGEGCTVVALALAKALADQQQRVILVDAHFDAPGLADSLGLAAQVGLEDTLTGNKPLIEALVESLEDRVVVLPLRQPAATDWRLSIARLKSSLDELRRHCDVVLIDAGPFGDTGDRRRLLSWAAPCRVDRALVVRDLRATSDDEAAEIERRLHGCGIAQWNFVENFAVA
jgi:Mrp family chromosome partitioning ATPase